MDRPKCWFYSPEDVSTEARTVFGTFFVLYCPVIITINALLITSILATKQSLRNTSNLLFVCLSCSDGVIGAVAMPVRAIESFWPDNERFCSFINISRAIQTFPSITSLLLTMLLAVDRYMHMNPNFQTSPSRISKLLQRPRVGITIVAACLVSAVISFSGYFINTFNAEKAFSIGVFSGVFFLVITISFVAIYTRAYLRIRRYIAENPIYANRRESNSNESPEYLNELFKTVLLLLAAMSVSWIPLLVLNLAAAFWNHASDTYIEPNSYFFLSNTAHTLFLSNCTVNALIIFYRNKKSKEWLVSLWGYCVRPRGNEEVQNTSVVIADNRAAIN